MKIYYYKQKQNTFALFNKRPRWRFRYIAISALLLLSTAVCYWLLHRHPLLPTLSVNSANLQVDTAPQVNQPVQNILFDEEAQATTREIQDNIQQDTRRQEELVAKADVLPAKTDPKEQVITVKANDSLSKIMARASASKKDLDGIMKAGPEAKALKKLKPGQKVSITLDENHAVKQLSFNSDPTNTLIISRAGNNTFSLRVKTIPLDTKQSIARFTVFGSIQTAAKKAGLNGKRTAQLATIFKSSVDINKGSHAGDKVSVLYQDYYLNDKKIKEGEIVAAEYKTATNTYQAVRFTDQNGNSGYYAPDGTSMQKRFLPAPLKFTRISSFFNPKRWHPVLHRFRHHEGVDYAAPYGTPIKSVASGTIAHLGRKGGYGNTIMIKHDSSYSTLYGHLSKYASGLKPGSHVKQGELIGYVGSSGLATGPHLHFEFRINGVHRNPLTVALPNGKSITHAYRNKFHKEVKKLLARMDAQKSSARS